MQVQSLGKEDPQKEGMTTHSSILVWRISWTEETGGLQSMRSRRVGHYYHFSMQSTSKSLMSNLNDLCVCVLCLKGLLAFHRLNSHAWSMNTIATAQVQADACLWSDPYQPLQSRFTILSPFSTLPVLMLLFLKLAKLTAAQKLSAHLPVCLAGTSLLATASCFSG